jgi:hypothetical protein
MFSRGIFEVIGTPDYRWVQTPEMFRALRRALFHDNSNTDIITVMKERFQRDSALSYVSSNRAGHPVLKCIFDSCQHVLTMIGEPHTCSRDVSLMTPFEQIVHTSRENMQTRHYFDELEKMQSVRQKRPKELSVMCGVRVE